jgi:hypothetical protein
MVPDKMASSTKVFAGRLGRYSDTVLKAKLLWGPSREAVLLENKRVEAARLVEEARVEAEMALADQADLAAVKAESESLDAESSNGSVSLF